MCSHLVLSPIVAASEVQIRTWRRQAKKQYDAWADKPATLQVVDKVGAPILEVQVTRDTEVGQIRAKVEEQVRKRHVHVLEAPVAVAGADGARPRHRTYTRIADVRLCKIENLADAFSGKLRELRAGERVDGCVTFKGRRLPFPCCCCRCCGRLGSAELGYVIEPPPAAPTATTAEAAALPPIKTGSTDDLEKRLASLALPTATAVPPCVRVVKLLYESELYSAKSRSSHHDSYMSCDRYEKSYYSRSPSPSSSSAGWSGGGNSVGGGSG